MKTASPNINISEWVPNQQKRGKSSQLYLWQLNLVSTNQINLCLPSTCSQRHVYKLKEPPSNMHWSMHRFQIILFGQLACICRGRFVCASTQCGSCGGGVGEGGRGLATPNPAVIVSDGCLHATTGFYTWIFIKCFESLWWQQLHLNLIILTLTRRNSWLSSLTVAQLKSLCFWVRKTMRAREQS